MAFDALSIRWLHASSQVNVCNDTITLAQRHSSQDFLSELNPFFIALLKFTIFKVCTVKVYANRGAGARKERNETEFKLNRCLMAAGCQLRWEDAADVTMVNLSRTNTPTQTASWRINAEGLVSALYMAFCSDQIEISIIFQACWVLTVGRFNWEINLAKLTQTDFHIAENATEVSEMRRPIALAMLRAHYNKVEILKNRIDYWLWTWIVPYFDKVECLMKTYLVSRIRMLFVSQNVW